MKTSLKYLVTSLLAAVVLCLTVVVSGKPSSSVCSGRDILIEQRPAIPAGAPRSPVLNPFYATLETNYVLLGSQCEYGVVEVTMYSTAGDYYSTDFITRFGTIILPISGMSGHYTMTLVTETGIVFVGEFDI